MDEPTKLLMEILKAAKGRLITVTNKEYDEVLSRIEEYLKKEKV